MANNFDHNYTIRKLVARHPQSSQAILEQLVKDPEPKVSRIAQQRLNP
jgi:Leucine rich repeat variant